MPTKTKPTQVRKTEPKTPTSALAATVRENVDDILRDAMKDFLEYALPEEKLFLREVLNDWESVGGRLPPQRGDYEIPLFTAIDYHYSSQSVIKVPDRIKSQVGKFALQLERETASQERRHNLRPTEEDIRQIWMGELRAAFETFCSSAGSDDLRLLTKIFYSWENLRDYNEKDRPDFLLASAATLELSSNRDDVLLKVERDQVAHLRSATELLNAKSWIGLLLRFLFDPENRNNLSVENVFKYIDDWRQDFKEKSDKFNELTEEFPELLQPVASDAK